VQRCKKCNDGDYWDGKNNVCSNKSYTPKYIFSSMNPCPDGTKDINGDCYDKNDLYPLMNSPYPGKNPRIQLSDRTRECNNTNFSILSTNKLQCYEKCDPNFEIVSFPVFIFLFIHHQLNNLSVILLNQHFLIISVIFLVHQNLLKTNKSLILVIEILLKDQPIIRFFRFFYNID
jgi:hypothetical protein